IGKIPGPFFVAGKRRQSLRVAHVSRNRASPALSRDGADQSAFRVAGRDTSGGGAYVVESGSSHSVHRLVLRLFDQHHRLLRLLAAFLRGHTHRDTAAIGPSGTSDDFS